MDAMNGQLPFMRVPHDTMREGLPGAKAGVTHLGKHPCGSHPGAGPRGERAEKRAMLANTYGIAMPRMDIEAQILARQKRLPGLPSSNFGAEILTNDVDRFGFESYLDNPRIWRDAAGAAICTRRWAEAGHGQDAGVRAGRKR